MASKELSEYNVVNAAITVVRKQEQREWKKIVGALLVMPILVYGLDRFGLPNNTVTVQKKEMKATHSVHHVVYKLPVSR